MKVIGFGDSVFDRFPSRGMAYPGGNCLNFAVFARQLGAEAAYLGVVGDDDAGRRLLEVLDRVGVSVDYPVVRCGETGWTGVNVVDGDRVFTGNNAQGVTRSEPIILDAELIEYLSTFDLVHSSAYSVSDHEIPRLDRSRSLVSYDFSSDAQYRTSDYLERLCPSLDLALFSCSDTTFDETKALVSRAYDAGATFALGTRGSEGAILFTGTGFMYEPAEEIIDPNTIKDTTGCGDGFLAAFVNDLLRAGWSRQQSVTSGSLRKALHSASQFAHEQCFVEGSFGYGSIIDDVVVEA